MDLHLKGKVVLVTASSLGIGRAVAELFVQEGCMVAICARTKEELIKTSDEIKKTYDVEPLWCVCDINSEKDIINTVEVVNKNYGPIDILVNNCGGPLAGQFETLSDENWVDATNQVLLSAVRFSRRVLPHMKEKRWGRIVNITSITVKQPSENLMLSNSLRAATNTTLPLRCKSMIYSSNFLTCDLLYKIYMLLGNSIPDFNLTFRYFPLLTLLIYLNAVLQNYKGVK